MYIYVMITKKIGSDFFCNTYFNDLLKTKILANTFFFKCDGSITFYFTAVLLVQYVER
jgi:hypothetical protein